MGRAVAWSLFALTAVVGVAAFVLAALNLPTPTPPAMSLGSKAIEIPFPLLMLTYSAAGALIVDRRSGNAVGWVLLVIGAEAEALFLLQQYGIFATLTAPGALPGGGLVLWLSTWSWVVPGSTIPLLPLIFPTGRPLSRRWWWVLAIAIASGIVEAVADALRSHPDGSPAIRGLPVENPIAARPPMDLLDAMYVIGSVLWGIALITSAWSLVLRYRRATGRGAREQLKWFTYATLVAALLFGGTSFAYGDPAFSGLVGGLSALSALLLPAAIGIAILRYRLYDIDLVIERTLVYGSLSAIIAGAYVGFVVLFQALLRPVIGGSEVAVAGSTLATLALVQPVRRRIQDVVDGRFYRSRYDAARTLDAFASRMRDEVDLEAVRGDLLAAIDESVRPTHAALWLRRSG